MRPRASTLLSGLAFPDGAPVAAEAAPIDAFAHSRDSSRGLRRVPRARQSTAARHETLFREPEKSGAASRRTIALAGVCVVIGDCRRNVQGGLDHRRAPAASRSARSPATVRTAHRPRRPCRSRRVELLALDHASTPAGLVVTGRVRNPADAASLHDVVAVVDVLDADRPRAHDRPRADRTTAS